MPPLNVRVTKLFQSTLSVRRATRNLRHDMWIICISIHALRKESDCQFAGYSHAKYISIHALRKESDGCMMGCMMDHEISIHALRKESDSPWLTSARSSTRFQSTLSVRRATHYVAMPDGRLRISIHALRKESDFGEPISPTSYAISIHALRKESDPPTMPEQRSKHISIHALRKESDHGQFHQLITGLISIHALRKESDHAPLPTPRASHLISIHALRKESDIDKLVITMTAQEFQSTLSVRRATVGAGEPAGHDVFQSTLSVRRATADADGSPDDR